MRSCAIAISVCIHFPKSSRELPDCTLSVDDSNQEKARNECILRKVQCASSCAENAEAASLLDVNVIPAVRWKHSLGRVYKWQS